MRLQSFWAPAGLALALLCFSGTKVDASTFVRASLKHLTETNESAALAEVVDTTSYWNEQGTFILTDVRLKLHEVVHGAESLPAQETTITVLGGTVDGRTVLIVGGAELTIGGSYVLFLSTEDLPGAPDVLTVRDHAQGAFEVFAVDGELRAISQAKGINLLPDLEGRTTVPHGADGIVLEGLLAEIQALSAREEGK